MQLSALYLATLGDPTSRESPLKWPIMAGLEKKTVHRFNEFLNSLYFKWRGLSVSWDKKYSSIQRKAFEVVEFFDSPVGNIVLKTEFF